ncbi:MAG: J domain-containing protein [Cyanothece sp. SIO1E1]|nr:J domain-containing protein [Cyanothece sp. SIO1E1]
MPPSQDYYQLLKVPKHATQAEIKAAFRRLARQFHPDLNPNNPRAEAEFKKICQAYEVLSDTVQRQQYDQQAEPGRWTPTSTPRNPQDFYVRGVYRASEQDYQGALADYTRAIQLNSRFVEAYLKRGQIHYILGDDRGVLEDCRQALEIDPQIAHAYYYQGLARYRLDYTQSAIDAYTQAIAREADYAQAYYHRGLAHQDLQAPDQAIKDYQKAVALFREHGDFSTAQRVEKTLRQVSRRLFQFTRPKTGATVLRPTPLLSDVFVVAVSILFNPGGSLLSAYTRLTPRRAMAIGMMLAAIAISSFTVGAYLSWQAIFPVSILALSLAGGTAGLSLISMSAIARGIIRRRQGWAGDIFLAGTTLLPLGLLMLASTVAPLLGKGLMLPLTVFASCYAILTLYNGYTQIQNFSEQTATFLVPLTLLVSGWLSYLVAILFS